MMKGVAWPQYQLRVGARCRRFRDDAAFAGRSRRRWEEFWVRGGDARQLAVANGPAQQTGKLGGVEPQWPAPRRACLVQVMSCFVPKAKLEPGRLAGA